MENTQQKNKKKSRKPVYVLVGVLLFFGGFTLFLIRPSTKSKGLRELETSFSKKDIELVWHKYKADLYQDEDFLYAVRKKLSDLDLTEKEVAECIHWLPPAPTSLNLIIVPDLSRRITDTINNPDQIANDLFVLRALWKSFADFSKLKQDTKDKLIVDVTDIDQAKGQFRAVANALQFDLSTHKGKSNRLFFNEAMDTQFETSINKMYRLAKSRPLGADYRFYFRRYLINHLKKPTLFDNYTNRLVIITDGYLEPESKLAETRIYGYGDKKNEYSAILRHAVEVGNILEVITKNKLNIPAVKIDLSGTEVLICEVNERAAGKGYDFEILKTYWEDWFKRMNVKKLVFIQREQASDVTAKNVGEFISN